MKRHIFLAMIIATIIFANFADARISSSTKQIDRFVNAKLKEIDLKPSKLSRDTEFLRRVHLDLTGRIPTAEEVIEFERGGRNKREGKIDELLKSDLYFDFWASLWTNWLIGRDVGNDRIRIGLEKWMRNAIETNLPYDRFVRELITATGDTRENPAGNFIQRFGTDPADLTAKTSRLFLGLPMQCAECHDHKTEPWYQSDFFAIASYFNGVRSKGVYEKDPMGRDRLVAWILENKPRGAMNIPGKNEKTPPRTLDGDLYKGPLTEKRIALGKWITNRKNRYFAKAIVNRIWAQFMGRGFVEPLDGFGEESPPTNPDLLDWLAEDFVMHGYDLKYLIRSILNTEAYQRSSETNDSNKNDDLYYSHALIKPLSAEQFFYSMLSATGFERLQKRRDRGRVESMKRQHLRRFIFLLENGEMEEIEAFNGTVPQALMMINGSLVNDSGDHKARGSFINYILKNYRTVNDRVEQIYLNILSRKPTTKEKSYFDRYRRRSLYRDKDLAYEDLYWSLLNSAEFALNY